MTQTNPKLALGAWAWGNDGTFGLELNEEKLRPVFKKAMESGLTLWDTAYAYGMGTSEKILGTFLKDYPREAYQISDKFTPQCADESQENPVISMFEDSCRRMDVNTMDYYWIHNPVGAPEWTRKLIPLAKSGKIKKIGLSNHDLSEIKEAAEILGKEGLKISAIQNHFSLLNRSSQTSGILDYCKENDIEFFAYMVLEQGALSGKYDTAHPFPEGSDRAKVYNPILTQLEALNKALKKMADAHGVSSAQIPVAWAISKGTIPIIGVTKEYQIDDALKSCSVSLSSEEINTLEELADAASVNVIRYWEKEMK